MAAPGVARCAAHRRVVDDPRPAPARRERRDGRRARTARRSHRRARARASATAPPAVRASQLAVAGAGAPVGEPASADAGRAPRRGCPPRARRRRYVLGQAVRDGRSRAARARGSSCRRRLRGSARDASTAAERGETGRSRTRRPRHAPGRRAARTRLARSSAMPASTAAARERGAPARHEADDGQREAGAEAGGRDGRLLGAEGDALAIGRDAAREGEVRGDLRQSRWRARQGEASRHVPPARGEQRHHRQRGQAKRCRQAQPGAAGRSARPAARARAPPRGGGEAERHGEPQARAPEAQLVLQLHGLRADEEQRQDAEDRVADRDRDGTLFQHGLRIVKQHCVACQFESDTCSGTPVRAQLGARNRPEDGGNRGGSRRMTSEAGSRRDFLRAAASGAALATLGPDARRVRRRRRQAAPPRAVATSSGSRSRRTPCGTT